MSVALADTGERLDSSVLRELGVGRPDAGLPRIPESPADSVLEIPPLVERPFDPEEGDRVEVARFELEGVRDLPRHAIVAEEVEAMVEEWRKEQPEQGFTIGHLEQLAERLTNFYRGKGLILARAVVPVQTVSDGVVRIELLEARLGQVLPEGNELFADSTLERPFRYLLGEPIGQQQTEAALLTLSDYPGVVAFGVFQPGRRVGESDLVLNVRNERRFEGEFRIDNHGSETTGEYRGRATAYWNNPLGNADRFMVMGQHTFEPDNSQFMAMDYEAHFGRGFKAALYGHSNAFTVEDDDLGDLEITGESAEFGARFDMNLIRSRTRNLGIRSQLASKESSTSRDGEVSNQDNLTVLTLGADFDSVDSRFDGLNYFGIEYSQGFNDLLGSMGDDGEEADPPPTRTGMDDDGMVYGEGAFARYMLYYTRVQSITAGSTLLVRTEYQYSDDLLAPLEQYAVGGPDHLRSHPTSHVMLDSGGLVSLEYILRAPGFADSSAFGGWDWGELMQVHIFYDHVFGEVNSPFPFQDPEGQNSYSGAGVGLHFNVPGRLGSRLQLATPIEDGETGNPDAEPLDSLRVWADVTLQF